MSSGSKFALTVTLLFVSIHLHAKESMFDGLMQGILDAANTATSSLPDVVSDVKGKIGGVDSDADRPLVSEPYVMNTYGFANFLNPSRSKSPSGFMLKMRPRVDRYFLANNFPTLQYSQRTGLEHFILDSFLSKSYGYRNAEQAFCDTLRNTIIENEYQTSFAGSRTNSEVISAILESSGSAQARRFSQDTAYYKVDFIDEFGGDLLSDRKKLFLIPLLQMSPSELEKIRYASKSEADKFSDECYKTTGGNSEFLANDFTQPENDYLLNKIPEVRLYLNKKSSEYNLRSAEQNSRAARDQRLELERQAADLARDNARIEALSSRQAADLAESERIKALINAREMERQQQNQRQLQEVKDLKDRQEAESRRKAALESLAR